ncbi:hypothetical protein D3C73_1358280 [compost metagenome]
MHIAERNDPVGIHACTCRINHRRQLAGNRQLIRQRLAGIDKNIAAQLMLPHILRLPLAAVGHRISRIVDERIGDGTLFRTGYQPAIAKR